MTTWIGILGVYNCWVCSATHTPESNKDPLPSGWRVTRRGYAGKVFICTECNNTKRRYQKDSPTEVSL